ncbi:MAG: helix-turn-helix transcriptional regulator [Firmicutes bacterium]|nr:helix-turn-helix transcriptional regulator [Bacillota bacterium]
MSRIGQKVKEIRTAKGLSPKVLGKKAGVSESFILEVEDGRRILNEGLITRLSKVLEVNLNEIGDFYSPTTDGVEDNSPMTSKDARVPMSKTHIQTPVAPPSPQWEHAFSNIIKDVPIYNQSMSKVLNHKKLVIQDNKVEGVPMDKAFYLQIEDANMDTLRFKKGDLILIHKISEIQGAGVYLINYQDNMRISEIKPLNNNLLLLGSHRGTLAAETAALKEVTILGKCIKAEVGL